MIEGTITLSCEGAVLWKIHSILTHLNRSVVIMSFRGCRCKKYEVPIEKIYNKTQRDKFRWAIDMAGPEFVF